MVTTAPSRYAHRPVPTAQPASGWWTVGTLLMLTAALVYVGAWFLGEPTGRGMVVGPLVVLLFTPLILRARATEHRFDLAGIMFAGLALKLIAIYGRYWMFTNLFDGNGDAGVYHQFGRQYASELRSLDFSLDVTRQFPGTGFLDVTTGVVYTIFGADFFTGFVVFGALGYLGCWFFYKAFATAVPEGDHKRYAILVFLWPSLVFWPSSVGKEAWILFSLGLASAGAAAAFSRRIYGYPLLGLGILCAAMIRPHIAIVVLAAAGVGLATAAIFGAGAGGKKTGIVTKVVGIGFLVAAAVLLTPRVATFLNVDEVDSESFSEVLDTVNANTSQGGSEYTAPAVSNPTDYPWAFATVLFRPFPYEARTAASVVSAIEGLLFMGLLIASANRLVRLPYLLVRNAYLTYAASFTFMFVYVFSFIANFGILARQRVQLLPFLLVLVSLPKVKQAVDDRRTGRPSIAPAPSTPARPTGPRPSPGIGVTLAPPRSSSMRR